MAGKDKSKAPKTPGKRAKINPMLKSKGKDRDQLDDADTAKVVGGLLPVASRPKLSGCSCSSMPSDPTS